MVLGGIVMNLMNGNSGVSDMWLDGLTLDHWLNVLVHMLGGLSAWDLCGKTQLT